MQDKKPDTTILDDNSLVIVTTPEYVKDSVRESIEDHAKSRNHPDATLQDKGFVTLNSDVGSDSETNAATPKAVKAAYDLANSANQNATNANNNANTRLAKEQNGADVVDKDTFVNNLGLRGTINQAMNALPKTGGLVNGGLILESDLWIKKPQTNNGRLVISASHDGYTLISHNPSGGTWLELRLLDNGEMSYVGLGVLILGKSCWRDSNGYIRQGSPIIDIWSDGKYKTNEESKYAIVERLSEGVYHIKGIQGMNIDGAWGGIDNGVDIPLCKNKLPLIWVDHEVLPDGSIKLMTYHREHSDAPAFARNTREGYSDGDLIDIPGGRFVSVRVQMPATEDDTKIATPAEDQMPIPASGSR
ncbi:phage tail protein [Xenorhabdus bovienii]|uniref:phage tail protein n=2 Tax=Xenorhabdus bovienii TaxID=40576 RepID=UPI0030B94E82|nr:phage tail protein [Xenorhabdus bovienii]MDE9502746.1 phage tail protein [Xenorhabdus bovienii]MDE9527810.1 phage tail protein [Xenorhabdus bovienii]